MRRLCLLYAAALAFSLVLFAPVAAAAEPHSDTDIPLNYDIPNGHFFTQANGYLPGANPSGYSVTNDDGVAFWDAYQQLGGEHVLGYPVTRRFVYDGFVTQAMQKMVFQWRPDRNEVWFLNTFDALHDKGEDQWLRVYRQTPSPFDTTPDTGLAWDDVVRRHQSFLDSNPAIKERYFADPSPVEHFGLPVAYEDMGNSFVIRCQRATFQYWKEDVPWAKKGDVSVANGGDLAKEAGLWPGEAIVPEQPATQLSEEFSPLPIPPGGTRGYRARSPEYGMNMFIWGHPETTQRDIRKVTSLGFGWQKTLFQWRLIEGAGKGIFDWKEADRVVRASNDAGLKMIVRVDFQPSWARADGALNGPPDDYKDFADFIYALVDRYGTGSRFGRVHAIEIWNEPNLTREWGGKSPDAAQYTRLLKAGYEAAKRADPDVTVISAGLAPSLDVDFLRQMYAAGAGDYFDVVGAHGAGFKAPPSMDPREVEARSEYGGHTFFCFRHVEELREVMVSNGDSGKQIWLTEFGWTSDRVHSSYAWHAVSEEEKARYILDAFHWAGSRWAPWIGVMAIWNLPDPSWTPSREEYWWAIANPDGTDRPAYSLLRQTAQQGLLP